MKIAQISDIHFSKIHFGPGQLFSKRWLGNLNLVLNRNKEFCNQRPFDLIPALKKQGVELCLFCGDFTCTGNDDEFSTAQQFAQELEKHHIKLIAIPGNHDTYTAENERAKTFYRYFSPRFWTCEYSLSEHGCTSGPLTDGWSLIALDTTCATSLFSSEGHFSPELEENLTKCIRTVPKENKILLMNHYPFFQHDSKRRRLIRGEALEALIKKHPQIQLYLHGHTHRRCLADLRPSHLPILLDPGSAAHMLSSWNLIDLHSNTCQIAVYHLKKDQWTPVQEESFEWKSGTKTG